MLTVRVATDNSTEEWSGSKLQFFLSWQGYSVDVVLCPIFEAVVVKLLIQTVLHVKTLIDSLVGPALSTTLTFTLYCLDNFA